VSKSNIPLSLYVHVPWCVRKCPYCDFNSHQVRDEIPQQRYVDTLIEDLRSEAMLAGDRPIHSIFIGGGTPSLFTPEAYQQILGAVRDQFELAPSAEVTLEANPGTFERERFQGYREAGINRVSIGVQSFNNDSLDALGRIHNGNEAIAAAEAASTIFDRFNLDLMHGLPQQTPELALADLRQALALNPNQISWYQLTLEPNTEFAARPPRLPVEEELWQIQEAGQSLLESAGYRQYEISAFARSGGESAHNINYWRFGDYIGIGAGAHGKFSNRNGESIEIRRRHKQRQPKGYMNPESRIAGDELIAADDRAFEFMLNALRLTDGFELKLFAERTGLAVTLIEAKLDVAQRKGLLKIEKGFAKPTNEGRLFLNDLLELFLD
jgi:putative oxygen-independent coproporphyrinogen III oxidase